MAIMDRVEVKIISSATERPLEEYEHPDPEAVAVDGEIQRYIESESGHEFKIEVTLPKGFCYHGADGIGIRIEIDGDALKYNFFRHKGTNVSRSGKLKASTVEVVSYIH